VALQVSQLNERVRDLLGEASGRTEAALDQWLPAEDLAPTALHRAMRYSVMGGGKRLRPALVISACRAVGGRVDDAMPAACAVELIHAYSLIHDDLPSMDDDDYRRGKPSCHKAFGEATAILAGDALLTLAFELIAAHTRDATRARDLILELSRAAGHDGMVGGQMLDIEAEDNNREHTLEQVRAIHTRKTGALIRGAVRLGALAGGARPQPLEALSAFGENIGVAFQIADDVLDLTATQEALGKTAGKDAAQGKATYPAVLGIEHSRQMAAELIDEALESLTPLGPAATPLRDLARFMIEREQ
jgi:geranylgeranyl diphosphate synthase type II